MNNTDAGEYCNSKLIVRMTPELHMQLKILSTFTGITMAEYARKGLIDIVDKNKKLINKHLKKT